VTASFTLTNSSVSIASPRATGASTITVTPSGGFTGSVTLSCSVTGPAAAVDPPTCLVAAPPAIAGAAAVSATLTIYTTAAASTSSPTGYTVALHNPLKRIFTLGGGGVLSAFLFFGLPIRQRRDKTLLGLLLLIAMAGGAVGCGGAKANATNPTNPGTTQGSYTVAVTGTSGNIKATTAVTVMVN
jgi:hypothetical protein